MGVAEGLGRGEAGPERRALAAVAGVTLEVDPGQGAEQLGGLGPRAVVDHDHGEVALGRAHDLGHGRWVVVGRDQRAGLEGGGRERRRASLGSAGAGSLGVLLELRRPALEELDVDRRSRDQELAGEGREGVDRKPRREERAAGRVIGPLAGDSIAELELGCGHGVKSRPGPAGDPQSEPARESRPRRGSVGSRARPEPGRRNRGRSVRRRPGGPPRSRSGSARATRSAGSRPPGKRTRTSAWLSR